MQRSEQNKVRSWIAASRPATLWAAVSPVAVGTACAWRAGCSDLWLAAACLLGAVFIQLGTNYVNDVADFRKGADGAERLGPPRAAAQGWLTANEIITGAVVTFILASVCGLFLLLSAGWPVVVIGVLSIAAGVAYTSGPYPLAYIGLGDVFVLVFFGFVAVCGTAFVQCGNVPPTAWLASIAVGALGSAILGVNNLRDRDNDRRSGKRTLVVRFGDDFGRALVLSLIGLAFVVLATLALYGVQGALLGFVALPLAYLVSRRVARYQGAALNPVLGQVARLQLVFCVLLSAGLVWL